MLKADDLKQILQNPSTSETSTSATPEAWFLEKTRLAIDPYFEREFFTNLIHCMDRKKSIREITALAIQELDHFGEYNDEVDASLLHLMTCYQASSDLRESYQWLPIFQGLFTLALFRGDARRPLPARKSFDVQPAAGKLDEFIFSIGKEARRVGSLEQAWGHLLFALENRTQRPAVCEALTKSAMASEDPLTFGLLMKALDLSFASAWKKNSVYMKRPFLRFWNSRENQAPHAALQGQSLIASTPQLQLKAGDGEAWSATQADELWKATSAYSAEAVWELVRKWADKGVSFDQWMTACQLVRGRLLFTMRREQWPIVFDSMEYANALESAARWDAGRRLYYLAVNICDLVTTAKKITTQMPERPSWKDGMEGLSANLGKNQLVLRLDDAGERGDRRHALDLLALILEDRGLSHSVSDRLLLMASKQDGWTYERSSIPTALILTKAYQGGVRMNLSAGLMEDALFGLLRYLSDQREAALDETRKRGNYGDGGLTKSTFDVSGGSKIVDRFVFNQLRNAQRIQVWPSEGKG